MKMTIVSLMGTLALAFGASASADAPDPREIYIQELAYGGSGCPQGSADVRLASDGSGFRLRFNHEFIARLGPGRPLSESRRNCQVNLLLHVPQGFTFAIASVEYRGRARILNGATGTQAVNYYFQGEADDTSSSRDFVGPFRGDWSTRHRIPLVELVWKPCGIDRSLNINASIRLAADDGPPHGTSSMSMDSERGTLDHLFQFSWRRCQ